MHAGVYALQVLECVNWRERECIIACVHVCERACMRGYMCVCVCMCVCECLCAYLRPCVRVLVSACVRACMTASLLECINASVRASIGEYYECTSTRKTRVESSFLTEFEPSISKNSRNSSRSEDSSCSKKTSI